VRVGSEELGDETLKSHGLELSEKLGIGTAWKDGVGDCLNRRA
jgi:hypothetical protein